MPPSSASLPSIVSATATPLPPTAVRPTTVPPATPTATLFFRGTPSPACGQLLPILPAAGAAPVDNLAPDAAALAQLQERMPEAARPALQRLLSAPQTVGLAAYRVGQETEGAYLNAQTPMPLASVVKLIHLVAYAEAVSNGRLNPLASVPVAALDSYYLPNLDLGAHRQALAELEENGRLFGTPPHLTLEDIPWMMVRHSSNAATDYLHMLLGQVTIEETAVSLNLPTHTAPCPFLGQFLAMDDPTLPNSNGRVTIDAYLHDPATYGRQVMLLTDAYSRDDAFRQQIAQGGRRFFRPSIDSQRYFSEHLNAQASALDYANLMARIAQNGLSNGESSFLARRYLEWPMRFEANQEQFSNLGYKGGALPGILTTVYYAYPAGESVPTVVALFYHNLPMNTYRRWRHELPYDELARWLLIDPQAIPALRNVLEEE